MYMIGLILWIQFLLYKLLIKKKYIDSHTRLIYGFDFLCLRFRMIGIECMMITFGLYTSTCCLTVDDI